MTADPNWKKKALLQGALLGLVTGLISAFLRIRQAESRNETLDVNSQSSAKVGIALFNAVKRLI